MNKTQFYLSQCADAVSKSPMCFTLGAVLVKGGKVISSGYKHRPHYDGAEVRTRGHRKPVSMHAEMHTIFSSPACYRPSASNMARAPAHLRSYKHCAQPKGLCPYHPTHNDGRFKARRPSLHARGHLHSPSYAWTIPASFCC